MNQVTQWYINLHFPVGDNKTKTMIITTSNPEEEATMESYLGDHEKKYMHIRNGAGNTLFWAKMDEIAMITRQVITYSPPEEQFKRIDNKRGLWSRVKNSLLQDR